MKSVEDKVNFSCNLDGEDKKCIQNFSVMTAQKTNASKTKGGWENNIKINKL